MAISKLLKAHHKNTDPRVQLWVVITTRQTLVHDTLLLVQLDGRHTVHLMRRRSTYVVMKHTGHLVSWDSAKHQWDRLSVYNDYQLAFLLRSDTEWMPLQKIPHRFVTNPTATIRVQEPAPSVWHVLMPAHIESHNDFMREINDTGDLGTATALKNPKIPWSGVRQRP